MKYKPEDYISSGFYSEMDEVIKNKGEKVVKCRKPHLRATVWNLLCCLWTVENLPELNTYAKEAKR